VAGKRLMFTVPSWCSLFGHTCVAVIAVRTRTSSGVTLNNHEILPSIQANRAVRARSAPARG
jgi:hypothetical protein